MAVEIKIKDFPKVFKKFDAESMKANKKVTLEAIIDSIPMLTEKSPVDTGEYANSWDYVEEETKILLGNYAPHAPIIEMGARPFKPPLEPLLAWAKRVLKSKSQPPEYDEEVQALARGTQGKIMKEGMEPKHILKDALPEILKLIKQKLKERKEVRPNVY